MASYDKMENSMKQEDFRKDAPPRPASRLKPPAAPRPAAPAQTADGLLRGDGIYCLTWRHPDGRVDHHMCLRFYPDQGKVIECSFTELPERDFFTIEERGFRQAVYDREGDRIHFVTVSFLGRIEYHGLIRPDSILMTWHSFINGRDFHEMSYDFIPDAKLPG